MRRALLLGALVAGLGPAGCGGEPNPGVVARMRFDAEAAFFDAPFPIDTRLREDGSLAVADFPNPTDNELVAQLLDLLEHGRDGFSLNGAVFIAFDGAIDPKRLPADPAASVAPDSQVFLVDISEQSPSYGQRIPIETAFKASAETYSPAGLLVALPFQGVVLAPHTRYALVVLRGLADAQGRPLYAPEALTDLLAGLAPRGAGGPKALEVYRPLTRWLAEAGIAADRVAAATVFTTGDPLAEMTRWRDEVAARPAPVLDSPTHLASYDGYCVIAANVELPVFQKGPKPYTSFGSGQLVTDAEGSLVVQERDRVEVVLTVPHGVMPEHGYPLVLYAAGAEGKARQVIDRTRIDADPDEGLGAPGHGPALHYARHGVAALGFPAPLAWERNPSGDGGLVDFWNVANLGAFRDNLRQGVLDFATLVPLVSEVSLDAGLCPEASSSTGSFRYDPGRLYLQGHSTGSTIGSAVVALEPAIDAAVLSGAGGSWIYNVVLAESPFRMKTLAGVLLGVQAPDELDLFDPVVTLFQTALESVEVMSWGRATIEHPLPGRDPKQLLLIEGVIDSYHFPRMVNAYGMSAGLDLVEPLVDPQAAAEYALVGRGVLAAPAAGNRVGPLGRLTAVTIQREQGEQDGHYVPFEHDDVKHRYGCFVGMLAATGVGIVPAPSDDPTAPCL